MYGYYAEQFKVMYIGLQMTDIRIANRINELHEPRGNGLTLTNECIAHIVNWEFDRELSEDDITRIYEGGEL